MSKQGVLLDTSIVVAIILKEEHHERLEQALADAQAIYTAASIHFEVGNALAKKYKRHELTVDEMHTALGDYHKLKPVLKPAKLDLDKALELATRHRIYAYDAYVIEVARANGLPLMTRDAKQASVAVLEGVELS